MTKPRDIGITSQWGSSMSAFDAPFIQSIVTNNHGSTKGTRADRMAFTQSTLFAQERVLNRLGVPSILSTLNQRYLRNTGRFFTTYGETDKNGDITATVNALLITPTALPPSTRDHNVIYNGMADNVDTPLLNIGLSGNAWKMKSGSPRYMDRLVVVMQDSTLPDDRNQFYRDSRRRKYRIAKINPSLALDQFSPQEWDRLQQKTRRVAEKLLKQKLHEDDFLPKVQRGTRKIVGGTLVLVAGALVAKGIDHINPDFFPSAGQFILQHIPHP